jgi:serine/threonine protein kinase
MSIVSWRRVKEIFHEALALPESERERFVAAACGGDDRLRAEVERLLAANEEAGEFLASPSGGDRDRSAGGAREGEPPAAGAEEGPGSRIGPYKLLQLIGEGGFGSVYMAEQEEPIQRRVALKIIKLGMDTREVIARFEAERQALAMMDHPNIAKVLDAGAAASGRPYFVMELIKGVPITEYADANRLSTRERLELFIDVCRAIAHANSKGIVHRDIKPSNVLVTLHDGRPVPKVIDFGVAKATNHRLTEKTLFTRYGEFVGTPAYMSPEQAEMSGLDVDHRSDIYSLGVLLYELLTGAMPFEIERLRAAAFVEVLRVLQEDDPPTPSSRLKTLGDRLDDVATRRQVEPHALMKLLRGDLDWIVMKAIEKDRRRRYDSAAALADDISRFFEHKPVLAKKPVAIYRLRKLARRRRGAILAAASLAGMLVLAGWLSRTGLLAPAPAPAPPVQRLIVQNMEDNEYPTPDGRYLLSYDAERRGYQLLEIESGRRELLTTNGPPPDGRFFYDNHLSPDGDMIAAIHLVAENPQDQPGFGGQARWELRTFVVDGEGEGRLLHEWAPGYHVQVFGWSPDQERIYVIVLRLAGGGEIVSIASADGSTEVLSTLTTYRITQDPSLSPDGRFIAYFDADSRDAAPDIFVLASDGSRQTRVEHPARDSRPMFAPDGSGVVFHSTRQGGDLWFLPLTDGRPSGEARPVWDDVGSYGMSLAFARNGSLFYFFAFTGWEVYTADLRLADGTVGAPEHVRPRAGEVNYAPAFSPDGRFLAHLRDRGRRLVVREQATGAEREFPLGGSLGAAAIDFCPDGGSVVVTGHGTESVAFRVDVDRGGIERLPLESPHRVVCLGDEIAYYQQPAVEPHLLLRRSLATGAETVLFGGPGTSGDPLARTLARSPDGTMLAFEVTGGEEARLTVVPSQGGEAVVVATSPVHGASLRTEFWGVMWLPNSRELLVVRPADFARALEDDSPEVVLWRVSADGTSSEEVARMRLPAFEGGSVGAGHFSMNPDGSRIAFERHRGTVAQIWAIDNLLPFIQSGASAAAGPGR